MLQAQLIELQTQCKSVPDYNQDKALLQALTLSLSEKQSIAKARKEFKRNRDTLNPIANRITEGVDAKYYSELLAQMDKLKEISTRMEKTLSVYLEKTRPTILTCGEYAVAELEVASIQLPLVTLSLMQVARVYLLCASHNQPPLPPVPLSTSIELFTPGS